MPAASNPIAPKSGRNHIQFLYASPQTVGEKIVFLTAAAGAAFFRLDPVTPAIEADRINEVTAAAGVTIDSVLLKDNGVTALTVTCTTELKSDTVSERTAAAGVTVDGVLLKDANVLATDVTATSSVNTDTIEERTGAAGVTFTHTLKAASVAITGGTISGLTSIGVNSVAATADQTIGPTSANSLTFRTNNLARGNIDSAGTWLIGTGTRTGMKFEVQGAGGAAGSAMFRDTTSFNSVGVRGLDGAGINHTAIYSLEDGNAANLAYFALTGTNRAPVGDLETVVHNAARTRINSTGDLAIVTGDVTFSTALKGNSVVPSGLLSSGVTTQAGATALTHLICKLNPTVNNGAFLLPAVAAYIGKAFLVWNSSASNTALVYPTGAEQIANGAASASSSVGTSRGSIFYGLEAGRWGVI